ncbi:MAG: hypothetical protein H5T33_04920 [Candidatus Methanosuratus sp.]|nr:hypothetical protein [Candidatus Methanosuratincola sp.]
MQLHSISRLPEAQGLNNMRSLCGAMDPVLVSMEEALIPPWTFLNINTGEDLSKAESTLSLFLSRRSLYVKSSPLRCPMSHCWS